MSIKKLELSMLCDIYGSLLSTKQKEALEMYCNEDYSLSEIAENTGISRQGVRDQIKHAEAQLIEFEQKLGLHKKYSILSEKLACISESEAVKNVPEVLNIIKEIQDTMSFE